MEFEELKRKKLAKNREIVKLHSNISIMISML